MLVVKVVSNKNNKPTCLFEYNKNNLKKLKLSKLTIFLCAINNTVRRNSKKITSYSKTRRYKRYRFMFSSKSLTRIFILIVSLLIRIYKCFRLYL